MQTCPFAHICCLDRHLDRFWATSCILWTLTSHQSHFKDDYDNRSSVKPFLTEVSAQNKSTLAHPTLDLRGIFLCLAPYCYLLLHMPYISSTNANDRFKHRKKNRLREVLSARIDLEKNTKTERGRFQTDSFKSGLTRKTSCRSPQLSKYLYLFI